MKSERHIHWHLSPLGVLKLVIYLIAFLVVISGVLFL